MRVYSKPQMEKIVLDPTEAFTASGTYCNNIWGDQGTATIGCAQNDPENYGIMMANGIDLTTGCYISAAPAGV